MCRMFGTTSKTRKTSTVNLCAFYAVLLLNTAVFAYNTKGKQVIHWISTKSYAANVCHAWHRAQRPVHIVGMYLSTPIPQGHCR